MLKIYNESFDSLILKLKKAKLRYMKKIDLKQNSHRQKFKM